MHGTGRELILNAAEGALQIILTEDGRPLAAQEWHRPERATELLTPALREMLQRLGLTAGDLRRIACVRGPGSFTGIRLVLATAAALRRAGNARLAGLDYMQALATSAVMARGMLWGGQVHVLTHARRNLVHYQPFMAYGPVIPAYATAEVRLLPPAEALEAVNAAVADRAGREPANSRAGLPLVCGSALARNALFASLDERHDLDALPRLIQPTQEALCLLARHGDYFAADVEPLYVRPCDAVENLPELSRRQGLDGAATLAELERLLHLPPQSEC